MRFGGWTTKFGGSTQFGGAPKTRSERYYNALKRLAPGGGWSSENDALINRLFRADATGLGLHAQTFVDRVTAEAFPHTAAELIETWETLLGVVPAEAATQADRQAAVVGRWRGANPFSLPGLRQTLSSYLNASTAFWDRFNGTGTRRFDVVDPGNGTVSIVSGTTARVTCSAGVDCSWDAAPTAARMAVKLPNREEDYNVTAVTAAATVAGDGGAGLVLLADDRTALFFGVGYVGSGNVLRFDSWTGSTLTEDIDALALAVPTYTHLRLSKEGNQWAGYYSNGGSTWVLVGRITAPVRPRYCGLYARNTISSLSGNLIDAGGFKLAYPTVQPHNVEVVEMQLDEVPAADPEVKFFFYVHREPTDPGSYDILNAQRAIDRAKKANTLGYAGESDSLLCDTLTDLCDRDILGA